ncbi:conserved hypothetical protein [Methylobacterium sp. 4-46]|uniref:hypothetical protein n=1 Tax=unclassified Methylobacterium TaxID=2615210 RepID=UPI000152E4FF|nr:MULTISPECIES: hypothetical protein [Methylobacterium]ACA19657.1 conserved hypothetical protein [Methylobacterium sp. 4-46]WFT78853.1 hypothetical protein QA634_26865 [Methylobacterium nodulans]
MRHSLTARLRVAAPLLVALTATPVLAQYRTKDVPSLAGLDAGGIAPNTILFTDHRDNPSSPESGLTPFAEWSRNQPVQKAILSPYPDYVEPDYKVTVNGTTKARHEALKVYLAEARFVVPRPADRIDLKRFASLGFLGRMDPAIKHRALNPADATPTRDPAAAFARRPDRPWCAAPDTLCIESRYDLEGKLPLGVKLANKLEEGGKKIAEFVSFQSELRVLPPEEAGKLASLTRIDAPVAGAMEQNIFWVNQILRFGKFLAVLQPAAGDPGKTVVTATMALGIKADVLDRKKEYERVPVLRNLLPAQVLMGNSSFNTGNSISAGLPTYARNRIAAFADALAKE